jgi:single-stranded-DNA-specific exonuclease
MLPGWRVRETDDRAVSALISSLALPEPLARVLVGRGLGDPPAAERFLRSSLSDLVTPFRLDGMDAAAERFARAVMSGERVLIHGDFDADGITATALLTLFLRELGSDPIPFLPNRLVEGHGISPRAIEEARSGGARLVVTCDCGSSSAEEIRSLSKAGIDTIVTDHHLPPSTDDFPGILVNPKASDLRTECDDLSGVGVAFMLATALRARLRDLGFFSMRPEPNLKEHLDVVALGTIADMAALAGQNRILVSKGLEQLAVSRKPGILAMRGEAALPDSLSVTAEDVGFRLAPRINASARMGHAGEALALLLTRDSGEAIRLASRIESWNSERKSLQEQMLRTASVEAERQMAAKEPVLFSSSERYHPGVIGLVAQKLAELHETPAFVFAIEGGMARGSARSRSRIDLMAAMSRCADLLSGFGGHREACGCTLPVEKLPLFRERFRSAAREEGAAAPREVVVDASLNFGQVNERFFSIFHRMRPFGVGNPEPVFVTKARVVGAAKEMGKGHLRVTLTGEEGSTLQGVGFGMWRLLGGVLRGLVEIAYTPEENEWKGRREVRIRIRGARSV